MFHRDKYGKPPYCAATEKETRNEFRRFMARYPDKYDYVVAQVCVKGLSYTGNKDFVLKISQ